MCHGQYNIQQSVFSKINQLNVFLAHFVESYTHFTNYDPRNVPCQKKGKWKTLT